MVTVDATAREHDGATLVTAIVEGGSVPTRVTLHNRLEGPVWPPRRMGEPVAGWDETGHEAVVPAEEHVALGYACPAPPADPPLELVASERVTADGDGGFESPSAVLRGLGSPAPPRDAVPLPSPADGGSKGDEAHSPGTDHADGKSRGREFDRCHRPGSTTADGATSVQPAERDLDDRPTRELPDPVLAWLDRTEDRIVRAESLAEATDVHSATEAVRAVGSLDAVATLERRRSTDVDHLREIARRANALAYRAESADVPVDTLERLA